MSTDPTTWRTMYDAVNPHAIPKSAQVVAGYVPPSPYAWDMTDFAMFPAAAHVKISVAGAEPQPNLASTIDIERGAFSPYQARDFIVRRNDFRPGSASVYVAASNLQSVISACRGHNYHVWVASWLGRRPLPAEVLAMEKRLPSGVDLVAWQYENTPGWDESVVLSPEWHPAPGK